MLYNNLKSDAAERHDELLRKTQEIKEEKEAIIRDYMKLAGEKDRAFKINEELRVKMVELVDHYEGKIGLLTEENGLLKTHRAALMQGGKCFCLSVIVCVFLKLPIISCQILGKNCMLFRKGRNIPL